MTCGGEDCDDTDPDIHPGAADTRGDFVDQNCDGVDGVDADGDGHASTDSGGGDCDDADPDIHPDAEDILWHIEELMRITGTAGRHPSALLDSAGALHVAYRNGIGSIRYGTDASGAFVDAPVADTGDVSTVQTSIALGPGGVVVIAFQGADDTVNVATRNGDGTFAVESIPGTVHNTGARALAVDAGGAYHVVFHQTLGGASDLGYATNASGSWVVTTPITTGDTGRDPAIVIDGAGVRHVFFQDVSNTQLIHAWDDGGGFMSEIVDDAGDNGRYASPFVDSDGALHVTYRSETTEGLRYATDASGSWVANDVPAGGNEGFHPSLVVDGSGGVHVGHYRLVSLSDAELYYASGGTGERLVERVTTDFGGGSGQLACVVDADGVPSIIYPSSGGDSALTRATRMPDGIDQDCDGSDG